MKRTEKSSTQIENGNDQYSLNGYEIQSPAKIKIKIKYMKPKEKTRTRGKEKQRK